MKTQPRILISSFNQIRNFKQNMIPISTAKWDPKWFHDNQGHDYRFIDKRGIINGLRCEQLVFKTDDWRFLTSEDLQCSKDCRYFEKKHPCAFEDLYLKHLRSLDFNNIITKLYTVMTVIGSSFNVDNPIVVLCVHESLSRYCAERPMLQQWFKENDNVLPNFEDIYILKK